jgi:hypothetical protein
MRRFSVSIMAWLATAPSLAADAPSYVTEQGHLICTRLDRLHDALQAVKSHDRQDFESIRECSQSKAGLKAEMLQEGPFDAKVRIYQENGESTVYWTSPTTLKEVRRR